MWMPPVDLRMQAKLAKLGGDLGEEVGEMTSFGKGAEAVGED